MSQTANPTALENALAAHRQGFPTRAIPIYEGILKQAPDDARALSLYGLALMEGGRPSEAEAPLRRAVAIEPGNPNYRLNLAELFLKIGEEETGVAQLRQINAEHPKFAPAFARLGRLHVNNQDLNAAAEALDAALQANPGDLQSAQLLARALAALKNFGAAYYVLDHAEQIDPDNIDTIKLRLEVARTRRDIPAMQALAGRLTKLAPENSEGWRDLAATLFEGGLFEDAALAFEKAMSISGRDAESLSRLASVAIQALDFEKAETALDEAERIAPELPRMLATRALLLTYQGRREEAERYCERCIKSDPDYASVYPQLSLLRDGRLTDEEEAKVRSFAARDDLALPTRLSARFVLAHSLDARGEYEAAFAEYKRANAAAAERNRNDEVRYDFVGHSAWTHAIMDVFPDAGVITDYSPSGPQPIFIVGLPRCGSTLVESVIAAHSKVRPGGELPMMPNIFNRWFKENYRAGPAMLSKADRERFAEAYLKGAPMTLTKERVTDKNLLNIEAAGFIAQIFPDAAIINVRRNPVENCFAIWRQDMMKFWAFATNFDELAQRYGLYAKLVDHFEKALPGRFHTIQYEDFVTGFPQESRRLIGLCGLEWEEACADFQASRGVAATISAVQVRKDVSLKGDRIANYGARLDPLRQALSVAGVDLATGALRKA